MPEFTEYRAGVACWVDLMATEPEAAREFYGELFGWEFDVGPPETGHYAICMVRGKAVGGMGGPPSEGAPVAWTTYFATDDVDASARKVTNAGGTVLMGPMDVMDEGRMAVALDAGGAAFGLWQAGQRHGADLANEPVSLVWSELNTPDLDAACDFYGKVFGYHFAKDEGEADFDYRLFSLDPDPGMGEGQGYVLGGLMGLPSPEVPPHWGLYFAVAEADTTVAKAKELGAQIVGEPADSPYGRQAGIQDPQGASFRIIGYGG